MSRSTEASLAALDRVLLLATLIDEDMSLGLEAMGLTTSRVGVVWLVHQSGPRTQRELAEALAVTPRNVTGLVDALVETGFVTRVQHPTDRRATQVTLTKRGARVGVELTEGRRQFASALFADLSDRRFATIVAGLDALLERLPAVLASG
ncbi:MAG: MarR family transcriptional regulator [Nocardioides sp.]